ncbi:MAG: cytidylate kinase [Clostridiales bacterium GWF2_38_85]|nr:MAG: cytidylate kinase [Clostridiales bacterium GWF2_38_85]HBL85346.1 (d)CMP kinase [Clostridiales bacterium]
MTDVHILIAIDGPSGSGKSTLAKRLAKELGLIYIDTGALYRTIGLHIQQKGLESTDTVNIINALSEIDITMRLENSQGKVFLNGNPVGDEIRTPKSSIYASDVSKIPEVRTFLLELQRNIAVRNSVAMDGRDIGTVILPNADVKIFLFADDEDRAERRYKELIAKGTNVTYEEVLNDVKWRDNNDKTREIAPAIPAEDAIMLNNSGMQEDETFEAALKIIKDKLKL